MLGKQEIDQIQKNCKSGNVQHSACTQVQKARTSKNKTPQIQGHVVIPSLVFSVFVRLSRLTPVLMHTPLELPPLPGGTSPLGISARMRNSICSEACYDPVQARE